MTKMTGSHQTSNVLTLIAPFAGGLKNRVINQAREILENTGRNVAETIWLSEGEACDIAFSGSELATIEGHLRDTLQEKTLDLHVQSGLGRKKRLLIADMDSTIVTSETLDELAEFAGLKEQISTITAQAMNGEILFRDAFIQRVAMLKGLEITCMDQTYDQIEVTPGAATLVATMKNNGAYTALASGGFRYFTSRIKQRLGFDFDIGNEIGIAEGKLNGLVSGDIVTKAKKQEVLMALASENGVELKDTLAVGDGANDLPMLNAAGLGVAYHAKPIVVAQAKARISHADLTALLFLQGYRRDQFVSD